jgi:hypothetical protein
MDMMVHELAMFRHEHKCINLNKNMIQQFVGICSGILFVFDKMVPDQFFFAD